MEIFHNKKIVLYIYYDKFIMTIYLSLNILKKIIVNFDNITY